MRRPTILFLNRVYPPIRGGTGVMLMDVAREMVRKGWHVTIVYSGPKSIQIDDKMVKTIRINGIENPSSIYSYIMVWLKMLFVGLKESRRHIVVSMSDPPMLVCAGRIIATIKGSKHVNWCQDLYPEVLPSLGKKYPSFVIKVLSGLRRWAMSGCNKVIVNGRCMKEYLVNDGMDEEKVDVITNWPNTILVDPERYEKEVLASAFPNEAVEELRPFDKQLKTKQRFRILYAGNIGLVHPVDSVLEAAEILEREEVDVEFVFVGDGDRFDLIAEERSRRGIDNIRLIPYQPDAKLQEVLESGDVHLITMKDDAAGFVVPSKFYSALAVARPCIFVGPEQCEVAKVVRDYGAGLVVPFGDVEQLVEAVKIFRESGEAWFGAHSGAVKAREVFTPQNSIDSWIDKVWEIAKDDLS